MKQFIDEYKNLEKLCSEIYGCQHGVTQYITEMENTPYHVAQSIPEWDDSLNDLKRLRHIRNALVHDTDCYDYTQDDVELIRSYYQRIMTQQDPLALLRMREEHKTTTCPKPFISGWDDAHHVAPEEKESNLSFGKAAAAFVITIAVAVGFLALGYIMLR